MTGPAPSKRAKSASARDLRYGRGGGRNLPLQSDAEQSEAFATAVAAGDIVRAHCWCESWWLIAKDVGKTCRACDMPMLAERTA